MAAGDTYRVRTKGTLFGQSVEFGVHLQTPAAGTEADDIAASWSATIMPLVVAATSSSVNWNEITVSDVRSAAAGGLASVTLALTQPNPGAVTGDCLPGQNAIVVGLRSGLKARRGNGRFFVPGVSEANSANGVLTGTQLTAVQALAQGILNAYGPGGTEANMRLVIYSPEDLTAPPVKVFKPRPGVVITPVTSHDVDQVIKTQRRRAIGVGA